MNTKDLEWSDKFSTDILSIDHQHQELLFLSQNLLNVLSDADATLADKQSALTDLVDHTIAHFDYEERVMRNIGYPGLERHMREHEDLRREISAIAESVKTGNDAGEWKGLVSMVQVWVLRHIIASDSKIREFIQRQDDDDNGED